MKKRIPIMLTLALALALAGCAPSPTAPVDSTPDAERAALEAQLQQISEQLAAMQEQLDAVREAGGEAGGEAGDPAQSAAPVQPAPTGTQTPVQEPPVSAAPGNTPIPAASIVDEPAPEPAKGIADYDIPTLEAETDALVERIGGAQPGSTRDATLAAYHAFERELEEMENKLDRCEDQAERDYRDGLLSRADYKEVDRLLELLEDDLDRAEDALEYRLGVDD